MNEDELISLWEKDKPIYSAWGELIVETIKSNLISLGKDIDLFLKIPPTYRPKDNKSLIDKAFYRNEKSYTDPYNEIEDKVGARFVVLLLKDINIICDVIKQQEDWSFNICKHFEEDRDNHPLLFTYQSVHYILRPNKDIIHNAITIPANTPCEVQIRTLLQHAHAELTHDAIYKSKRAIRPKIHRTVAKSMALIETTDDFFTEVTENLYYGPLDEHNILEKLNAYYYSQTGISSRIYKSSLVIWDTFEDLIDDELFDNIVNSLSGYDLSGIIKARYNENILYEQSILFFIYWLLKRHKTRLVRDWPLNFKFLNPLALDLGISISDE